MPKRAAVMDLPKGERDELDQLLIEVGFKNYKPIADKLRAKGYTISKSSLHRYGSLLEKRVAQLKVATEQAQAIVKASPDDEGAMSEALIRLTQEKLFGVLMELDVDLESINLPKLTKAIADLARSSISTKRYATEVRAAVREELLAEQRAQLEAMPNKGGVTPQTKAAIREALGIT